MPQKKLYLQVSFEGGMVDTVVSDYDYQDGDLRWQKPQSRSAVYIKNYDPSLVKGALTKRGGYALLRETNKHINGDIGLVDYRTQVALGQSPAIKGLPVTYSQSNINNVDLSRFTTLVDLETDQFQSLTTGRTDPFTVCGATVVPYNKPIGQNVLVYFLRHIIDNAAPTPDEERTRIVHYGWHVSSPNTSPRWYNALTNGQGPNYNGSLRTTVEPAPFPGWDIRGTFTDAARHGGTLVITTDVAIETHPWANGIVTGTTFTWTANPWTDDMYPCYVWSYWDIRRKRDKRKFWQIIRDGDPANPNVTFLNDLSNNYTADDKYSLFKVLQPSMRPTRDTSFVSWRTYIKGAVDGNSSLVAGSCAYAAPPFGGEMASAVAYQTPYVAADNLLTTEPINSAIEVAIVEARGRVFNITPIPYVNDQNPLTDRLTASSEYRWLNNYNNYIQTIEIPKNYDIQPSTDDYWKVYREKNTGNVVEYITVTSGVLSYSNVQRVTKIVGYSLTNKENKDLIIGNGKTGADFLEIKESAFYWTVGVTLPDYLQDNCPRPWLKGEKIPLLLTGTIRGVEIVLSKYTHVVTSDDYEAYPTMQFPRFFYEETFGQMGANVSDATTNLENQLGAFAHNGPAVNRSLPVEQYYLALNQSIRFNGKTTLPAAVRGYALSNGTFVAGQGNNVRYRLYEGYKTYCIEPFNSTANAPYVAPKGLVPADSDDVRTRIYARPVDSCVVGTDLKEGLDNFKVGYRREHTNPKLLLFTIKLKKSRLSEILEQGIESLNLYCAQASDISAFNSVGLFSLQEPTPGIYMLPDIPDENEYSKYRLVKKFVLDGDGSPFHDFRTTQDDQYWKDFYRGAPVATNSWVEVGNSTTGFLIATGQHETEISNTNASNLLTPDFLLWDYPISAPLSLNSSGNYWQGRGAKLTANIKGRTFIGGCLDRYGEEEQALIRYSDVQSGVISLDVFSEENYIKVGGLPHVAFTEYREHLWVYSRSECHRIQMPDVVDVTSWEYLDKIPGQGTYNQKTLITTPHGVVWANEGGVWLSDGRMPENLAQSVLTFYKRMATNFPPYYATKIELPQFPFDENGINPYMEVAYNEFANELVICSPTAMYVGVTDFQPEDHQQLGEEYRLVYSFDTKLWHVEHADLPRFGTYLNEFDAGGKVTF
jgi:hypothetical protein